MHLRLLLSRLLLLAVYAVGLTLIWPWVGESYARAFRASAMAMCGTLSSTWDVKLEPLDTVHHHTDTVLHLTNRKQGQAISQDISIRYIGYAPTSFLVALILATPLPWKRRGTALLWGFVLMHVWLALCMVVLVLHGYSPDHPVALYNVSPWMRTTLSFLRENMIKAVVVKYSVTAVIWILASFRRSDAAFFLSLVDTGEEAGGKTTHDASSGKRSPSGSSK